MSKTALIIDDDRKAQAEVKQILSQANLFDQYLEANDGIEGFKILLNKEVIAVDQDSLGKPGMRLKGQGALEPVVAGDTVDLGEREDRAARRRAGDVEVALPVLQPARPPLLRGGH